jgi:hypothetical protein
MTLAKLFVPNWRMFAPVHLPAHPTISRAVLFDAFGHVAVGNEIFRQGVGACIECTGNRYEMIGSNAHRLEPLAAFQSNKDRL